MHSKADETFVIVETLVRIMQFNILEETTIQT